jgi:protein TonB
MMLGLASAPHRKLQISGRVRRRIVGAIAYVVVATVHALLLSGWITSSDFQASKPAGQPIAVSLLAPVAPVPQPQQPADKPEPKPQPDPKQKAKAVPKPVEQSAASTMPSSAPPTTTVVADAAPELEPIVAVRFDADYLNNPSPKYPALSRRLREQGVVMVRVHVLSDGLPQTVELKSTSGSERLDQAALDAVRQWRFVPAKRGSEAIAAWVVVPISFSLGA